MKRTRSTTTARPILASIVRTDSVAAGAAGGGACARPAGSSSTAGPDVPGTNTNAAAATTATLATAIRGGVSVRAHAFEPASAACPTHVPSTNAATTASGRSAAGTT